MPQDTPTFEELPLILRLAWDPFRALDLVNDKGKPDHGKVMPAVVMACIIVAHFIGNPIGDMLAVILVSGSYGFASWRTFLNTKALTVRRQEAVSDSTTTNITVAPRDTSSGIQPTSN